MLWICGRVFDDAVREIWYFRRASINIELSEKINSTKVIFYAHNNFSSQITVVAAYSCNPGIENSMRDNILFFHLTLFSVFFLIHRYHCLFTISQISYHISNSIISYLLPAMQSRAESENFCHPNRL